jgi:hypothetical protein
LLLTRWLCGYCPVRIVALEGQQSAEVTNALSKVMPLSAMYPVRDGTFETDAASRSSAIMKMMLGRPTASMDPRSNSPDRKNPSARHAPDNSKILPTLLMMRAATRWFYQSRSSS